MLFNFHTADYLNVEMLKVDQCKQDVFVKEKHPIGSNDVNAGRLMHLA